MEKRERGRKSGREEESEERTERQERGRKSEGEIEKERERGREAREGERGREGERSRREEREKTQSRACRRAGGIMTLMHSPVTLTMTVRAAQYALTHPGVFSRGEQLLALSLHAPSLHPWRNRRGSAKRSSDGKNPSKSVDFRLDCRSFYEFARLRRWCCACEWLADPYGRGG